MMTATILLQREKEILCKIFVTLMKAGTVGRCEALGGPDKSIYPVVVQRYMHEKKEGGEPPW